MGEAVAPLHSWSCLVSSEVSDSLLEDLIAAHLVLPNRVTVPVKKGLDLTNLRFPLPCVSSQYWPQTSLLGGSANILPAFTCGALALFHTNA